MKPLGRKPINFPSKTDHHIRKHKNWWEDISSPYNNKTHRQDSKKHILRQCFCVRSDGDCSKCGVGLDA